MGNPKKPADISIKQGITAYQKVLKQKENPPRGGKKRYSNSVPPAGGPPAGGLLKTGDSGAAARGAAGQFTPRPAGAEPVVSGRRAAEGRRADEPSVRPAEKDSKVRRVAKFLILIGGDQAAKILAELDTGQVEALSREIASLRGIRAGEGEAILAEFRSLFSAPYGLSGASSGGVEAARRILYAAFGPEKGEALLNKTVPDSKGNLFGFLEDFSPEQLGLLLKDEAPTAAALILSRLPSKSSADVLAGMNLERKLEIARRIARQAEVSPEVLERVAAAVKDKARHIGRSGAEAPAIDGMKTLAAILKQGDYSFGDRLIGELEEVNPDLGRDLKERLYTLDDVTLALDRPLQEKLRTMSDKDIAVLLKGRGEEFGGKILSNVSSQRREAVVEEGEILGAVPKSDCDAAAREFLAWFRKAREDGSMPLLSDEDVFV
ncbi:MAG: flagellar motor switch protein FliG [Treponema sp.]|jgi:flagellar motor switch protein FliG|nr:flagellar motor switch protein FliG [Treponema sp.]